MKVEECGLPDGSFDLIDIGYNISILVLQNKISKTWFLFCEIMYDIEHIIREF